MLEKQIIHIKVNCYQDWLNRYKLSESVEKHRPQTHTGARFYLQIVKFVKQPWLEIKQQNQASCTLSENHHADMKIQNQG